MTDDELLERLKQLPVRHSYDFVANKWGELAEKDWDYDVEASHSQADAIISSLLERLGYVKSMGFFKSRRRWYA